MSRLNMLRDLRIEHENILKHIRDMEELERYRSEADEAWGMFDRLSDMSSVSEKEVSYAEQNAIKRQQAYFQLYYELNSDQCTCKPDSAQACDVCQAQINAKSMYREEM